MAKLINLPKHTDERGSLTVIQQLLPHEIKRVFYLYEIAPGAERGGHGHYRTMISLISVAGSCKVRVNNGKEEEVYELDSPNKCLILNPEDWHIMTNFQKGSVLLALASEDYDKEDYFYEEPT